MDLTQEQLDTIVERVLEKSKPSIKSFLQKQLEDLDIPDTKTLATKKMVTDTVEALRNGFNEEFKKTNEAITKVAAETEIKIQQLTSPKSKPWWTTIYDHMD